VLRGGRSKVLDLGCGPGLYAEGATRGPATAVSEAFKFLGRGVEAMAAITAAAVLGALVWFAWRWVRDRERVIAVRLRFATVDDANRRAVRAAYARAEVAVARAGFRRRQPSESLGDYSAQVRARFTGSALEFAELTDSASLAAYSDRALGADVVNRASLASVQVRESLKRPFRPSGQLRPCPPSNLRVDPVLRPLPVEDA
jgi:hypothetical protein